MARTDRVRDEGALSILVPMLEPHLPRGVVGVAVRFSLLKKIGGESG